MTGAVTHSVLPPPEEVASAIGHALNNVLPFLYAASSFLDGEDEPPDMERARRALDDACRNARILSAALSTLGLASADAAGLPPFGQCIDAEALAGILAGAEAATGARVVAPPAGALDLRTTLDLDSISALVVCAATAVRRACGPAAALSCTAATAEPGALAIEVTAEPRPAASARRGAPGPCELALAHAARVLGALGARVEVVEPGRVRMSIAARAAA
jgi:hypothetical protein